MANVFQKGTKFAATALDNLVREVKLPGLFKYKYGKADFAGALGDVVNVKRPPILRARDAGFRSRNALVADDLAQTKIQIALTRMPYSRVALSPEEATLDDVEYVRDIQLPQVQALTEDFEETEIAALRGATYVHEVDYLEGGTGLSGDPRKVASRARRLLNSSRVPSSGRYWLVGAGVSEAIQNFGKLVDVDTSGLPEALRDGVVTKLRGFIVIEVPGFDEDESYFVHDTAVALAAVAPVVPNGAKGGASIAGEGGLGITQVWDYNSATLADQSTVYAFTGATVVKDPQLHDADGEGYLKGQIVLSDGNPVMEFVRAVKVNFTADSAASEEESSSSSS